MNIVIAILVFSLLILFHELGHFSLAKLNGIRVNEFSLGLGPTIFGFTKGETKYSLKLLPFGGACMMEGEDEDSDDDRAFNKKGVWARISVVAAGPIFNFIMAVVFSIVVISAIGIDRPEIYQVTDNSPASHAGLLPGDMLTQFDGKNIHFGREMFLIETLSPISSEEAITIKYMREGKEYTTTLTPVKKEQYLVGFTYTSTGEAAVIQEIVEGGALSQTEALAGDVIVAINGTAIDTADSLEKYFSDHPTTSNPITLTLSRVTGDKTEQFDVTVTPQYAGIYYDTGFVYNKYNIREKTNFLETIYFSFCELGYYVDTTFQSLKMLLTGGASVNDLSGPVGIVQNMGESFEEAEEEGGFLIGILTIMNWAIMLSANLGVMNLLPIPALDGGRLVFLIIEAIRGKAMDPNKEGMVHMIGIILLFLLMFFVMFNDIRKLFI